MFRVDLKTRLGLILPNQYCHVVVSKIKAGLRVISRVMPTPSLSLLYNMILYDTVSHCIVGTVKVWAFGIFFVYVLYDTVHIQKNVSIYIPGYKSVYNHYYMNVTSSTKNKQSVPGIQIVSEPLQLPSIWQDLMTLPLSP